ncbi:MAG TPA: LysR substrate-binding domain-containing protein [Povalibacter sp.]|uniref:LysR family transcriptional regulator n=1 Tax=Povalibacter sp. TaxID=1962978 RepID=UPI002D030C36|nr:LysR substrate-binding domain-containing protein [Povalibacter sp.]HMN43801.1 LysR substrate-binding domain-containing protein [Povalibacter sp.]
MTPRQLSAFVAVAQTLSFARACERLHMSQPALSLAIRSLEDSLGGRLLSRTTRQVRLTPEGAALLPQAVQLLADWDNVRQRSRQHFTLQRGHVTIAAMPSFAGNVLPRILEEFRRRFPNIEVTVHDVIHEDVVRMVATGRVELGFGFEPEGSNQLDFQQLFMDRFVAIVPARSPLADLRSVSWTQLLGNNFIALQRPSTVRQLLERSLAASNMKLRVGLECHQLVTAGQFVASGLGVSAVPSLCKEQMTALGAKSVQLIRPAIRKAVGLMKRNDQQLSTAAEAIRQALVASNLTARPRR